ncbi:MAG TPA: ATP-binding protein [Bryobacteraceae bacterium]|nr:ATP-binding protein [Bryobacteraceae bacterium]
MRWQTLLFVWLMASATAVLVGASWSAPLERLPYNWLIALAVSAALVCAYSYFTWRRLARYLRRLEDYAASMPASSVQIPADLPVEFAMLSSALRRASEHAGSVIERANLELARRETILAGMAEGVLAVDSLLQVTFCNEAFAEAFRTRKPVSEGRPLYEVVREPALREILAEVMRTGRPARHNLRLPAAEGRSFEIHALPFGDPSSKAVIAVLHDITNIERQEQARKDFVANVSHELRTPLAAIRGYAETLLDGGLEDSANNRKFVEIIQSHAIRLNNISSDLLALSEMDSNAYATPVAPIGMRDVVDSALHTVAGAATLRSVSIRSSGCAGCTVLANRLRLEQVMVNLLDNAVKFNREGGTVSIDCAAGENNSVNISIADTGIGIASEDLKRIFERFYRVDRARSRQAGGTGLGLSIVKQAIERMGGSVTVSSRLGQGACFTIQLPSAERPPKLT